MFWSDVEPHVKGNATLTRISSKLPVAKSLPRPSKPCGRGSSKASGVAECQTTSCHNPTSGAVCLRHCVKVLRHSHFPIVPFCRTCAVNGMRATLSWLHFFTRCPTSNFSLFACVSTPHMKMILEVFKSTLLSPSNETRRFTTHAVEPQHAAKIQLSCRPCMHVRVLEESAEVRNTVLRRDSHKDHESDAKSTRGSMPWPSVRKSLPMNNITRVLLQTTSPGRSGSRRLMKISFCS